MVKEPRLLPAVAALRLAASPPTAETVRASVLSGSVSLASRPLVLSTDMTLLKMFA